MAPGETNNKPNPAPPEQPSNPIDQALEAFKQKNLSHTEIVGQLESLKQQVQQENTPSLNVQNIPALREAVVSEVDSGGIDSLFTDAEQKNTLLADLDKRLDEIEQIVQQKATPEAAAPEPSLLSKEGMLKAFNNLGGTIASFAVAIDQFREQIAVSIGGSLDMFEFLGKERIAKLKSFLGEERTQLSSKLSAEKISLPIPAFIQARKAMERIRAMNSADRRGWNAEKMALAMVGKLKDAGITGKEDADPLKVAIDKAAEELDKDVLKDPIQGVNFADAGKPSEVRMNNTIIAEKQVSIMSDGSITVAGQKWQMKKAGKEIAVNSSEPLNSGSILSMDIQEGTSRQAIALTEDLPGTMNNLASTDTNINKVEAKDKNGTVLIEFIRTS